MTLAFWSELVKRQHVMGWITFVCALVVLAGFWFIWQSASLERSRAEEFGAALAETLAMQGVEAMLEPDTVHLFLLTSRVGAMRGVLGAGFYTAEGVAIAESGDMATPVAPHQDFTRPVVMGQSVTGEARIRLHDDAFAVAASGRQIIATIALLLLTPLFSMLLAEMMAMRSRRVPIVDIEDTPEPALQPRWLVVGNFYNQLSFAGDARREIQERIMPKASRVAELYHGHARSFSGGSLLLEFDEDADNSFQAMCAAWLLSDVLDESDPDVEFRFALHRVMASPTREVRAEVLADGTLLAALAPEDTLIASHDFMTALEKPERCVAEPLQHPMLSDISSINGPAYCIRALGDPQATLLRRQVDVLLGYSTVIASTR